MAQGASVSFGNQRRPLQEMTATKIFRAFSRVLYSFDDTGKTEIINGGDRLGSAPESF